MVTKSLLLKSGFQGWQRGSWSRCSSSAALRTILALPQFSRRFTTVSTPVADSRGRTKATSFQPSSISSRPDLLWKKTTPAIGAELIGKEYSLVKIAEDADLTQAVYDALTEHHVLFFRDQADFTAEHQLALARSFGTPEPPHPVYRHVEGCPEICVIESDAR